VKSLYLSLKQNQHKHIVSDDVVTNIINNRHGTKAPNDKRTAFHISHSVKSLKSVKYVFFNPACYSVVMACKGKFVCMPVDCQVALASVCPVQIFCFFYEQTLYK